MSATLTTLISFKNGVDGGAPQGDLIADANGDLFGTTQTGGMNGGFSHSGTVFEIARTGGNYASTPTTLVSFNGANGELPGGSLLADREGDLFGTTAEGGASGNGFGTMFEIAKTAGGYASAPTTLVTFDGLNGAEPVAGLVADFNGDLFGTTEFGGANDRGTVFEIKKTPGGYASTPTTLVSFSGANGRSPAGSLIADANGDLFGTTSSGGADGFGTVFEIAKTSTGYANAPITLVSFNDADGSTPEGSLLADANGDLFGTTSSGGGGGTVFEIARTSTGYASAPITLASFNFPDSTIPHGSLIADANGDLFGTTGGGGGNDRGSVFEIKRTAAGYASRPITVARFADGGLPLAALLADADGDLFGTTQDGGANDTGSVFEITDSGFVPPIPPIPPTVINDILLQNVSGQAAIWDVSGATLTSSALLGANPGPNWKDVGTGDFNDDAHPDILLQNTSGNVAIWETNGTTVTSSAAVANPGPNWKAVGTGDFNDDHHSDILLQNTNGNVAIWEMNGTNLISSAAVANPGPNWKVVGTGDFNDDGHSDILLQNTNGNVAIWEMNGTDLVSSAAVASPGANWHAIGTGDFNGDSHSDILLQNTNGNVAVWEMNGTDLMSSAAVANPGANWHAIGTNGGSDILLQNTSGQTALWDMSGTQVTGSSAVSANAGPNWRAVGLV
jgi:uncharacterized repeat protein (TIGR03803 family)